MRALVVLVFLLLPVAALADAMVVYLFYRI